MLAMADEIFGSEKRKLNVGTESGAAVSWNTFVPSFAAARSKQTHFWTLFTFKI